MGDTRVDPRKGSTLTRGCSRSVADEDDECDEMVGEADGAWGRTCLMMRGPGRLNVVDEVVGGG